MEKHETKPWQIKISMYVVIVDADNKINVEYLYSDVTKKFIVKQEKCHITKAGTYKCKQR